MDNLNEIARDAWNANAETWDARMGDDGNDFFNLLCWPVIASYLDSMTTLSMTPLSDPHILDIACGNGLTSRRLASFGATVTAFDFSATLIEFAQTRPNPGSRINYHVADATDEDALLALGEKQYDFALANMALFDMPDIETLFRTLPKLLKPNGVFVFSIVHSAFNNPACTKLIEEWDDGQIHMRYAVKVTRYMTPFHEWGLALHNQPRPQPYFHRSLQDYFNIAFQNGFVMDGFAERAFSPDQPQTSPLNWGGNFSEIPPVLVARMRLIS